MNRIGIVRPARGELVRCEVAADKAAGGPGLFLADQAFDFTPLPLYPVNRHVAGRRSGRGLVAIRGSLFATMRCERFGNILRMKEQMPASIPSYRARAVGPGGARRHPLRADRIGGRPHRPPPHRATAGPNQPPVANSDAARPRAGEVESGRRLQQTPPPSRPPLSDAATSALGEAPRATQSRAPS